MQDIAALFALLPYPAIDPVAFSIGPVAVRWYGIAYVVGILAAWQVAERLVARERLWPGNRAPMGPNALGDFIVWATLGIVLGGRLVYAVVYDAERTLADPLNVIRVWNGGMSFHGGLLGTLLAMILYARRTGIRPFSLMDTVAAVAPLGIFLVRLTNFINSELWGRVTDAPWGMIFPNGGPEPRHPSQLYEAALEGLLLFVVLQALAWRTDALKYPGRLAGLFACGYGLARIFSEFFRGPDANLGYFGGGWLTMGMILSVPLVLVGLWAVARSVRIGPVDDQPDTTRTDGGQA